MPHIVGLSLLVLWSLGYLTPYSIIGFFEILFFIAFIQYILRKIKNLNFLKFKSNKKVIEPALENII